MPAYVGDSDSTLVIIGASVAGVVLLLTVLIVIVVIAVTRKKSRYRSRIRYSLVYGVCMN